MAAALTFVLVQDEITKIWESGYKFGYQQGFQKGLSQRPKAWKTLAPVYEID